MNNVTFALTFVAVIGCGIAAGAFYAFSGFIMKALDRLPPAQGIAAMQSINIVAVTPPLMIAVFGTGLVCLALTVLALLQLQAPGALYRLAGSLLYLIGAIVVTMVFNVPRNNALAAVDANSQAGAALWAQYVPTWTTWNTVRTVAAVAAAIAFIQALLTDR
jgi:uncharacterized membrane protein